MPILLVRTDPGHRLELCSGVSETNEPCFRPGSLVPSGDWRPANEAGRSPSWERFDCGKQLRDNIALIRVFDSKVLARSRDQQPPQQTTNLAPTDIDRRRGQITRAERKKRDRDERDGVWASNTNEEPSLTSECSPDQQGWPHLARDAVERLEAICKQLSVNTAVEHKGRWLAKGCGKSMSTTWDRGDGKLTGLHIDRWERRSLDSLPLARNRVCLNLGPRARWLVFLTIELDELAALCGQAPTASFTTSHAVMCLRKRPQTPVYRLRVEPGEAYVAPTERLIHDGQASSVTGEWVYTMFGRFERTEEAMKLSVV